MKADILRQKFLDFFSAKRHKLVESDTLIPKDDPTVLFTPAGMNQFKRQFLGRVSGFTRAATAQRCLRTDDLDKVGKTSGHHTFFEMLGNFSFGDYFKEEAVAWAWGFLSAELKIKKDKLWVSVYKDDDESYRIWKDSIKIPREKIIKLGDKENFWPSEAKEKGPNGPCGPCSEIFFDRGRDSGCASSSCRPGCNCGRFVEVWNLVFTQFNRKAEGIIEPLPKKNIDTGMGLERLTALMQGAPNNFETDLFQPILREIEQGINSQGSSDKEALYAIADHIRAIVFAIYDGVMPSNEGRGYVIRKLIRKSILHLHKMDCKGPFLYKLVPVLSEIMKAPYPELDGRRENIAGAILAEEENFISALNSSDTLFEQRFKGLLDKADPQKAGVIAFSLYDTYGMPWELTLGWLAKHGVSICEEAFNRELNKQKERSKSQSAMKGDVFQARDLHFDLKETRFLGYKGYETEAQILKIIKDNAQVKRISKGDRVKIILDRTVFYAEAGGQAGDTGEFIGPARKASSAADGQSIRVKSKNIFEVTDTRSSEKIIIHTGEVKAGVFKKNDLVLARINPRRRQAIARNHTATHLLQAALRKVLGSHVRQQGSLVSEDKLRFDFTHFKDMDKSELDKVEEIVNQCVINNYPLKTRLMPLSEARKSNALAFFGDKYEKRVRVVSVADFSQEFCAGTHLDSTAAIGIFKITQEGSVASGIRRIEAITGTAAYEAVKKEEKALIGVSSLLGAPSSGITQELEKRLNRIKELEKELSLLKLTNLRMSLDELMQNAEFINGIKMVVKTAQDLDMDILRKSADLIKQKTDNTIAVLASKSEAQCLLVIGVTADLCAKGVDASGLIRAAASIIGGSGGGRKDFAQAGGNKPEKLDEAVQELKNIVANMNMP